MFADKAVPFGQGRSLSNVARCIFPLRTSVEWFDNQASPAIEGRAKQAAVLYDEVVFEDGFVEIDITDGGSIQAWHPSERRRRSGWCKPTALSRSVPRSA